MSDATQTLETPNEATEEAIHLRPLPKSFDIQTAMLNLKQKSGPDKQYLPVQWRLVWFREICKTGTIDTEELAFDLDREIEIEVYEWDSEKRRSVKIKKKAKGYARYRAVIEDGMGGRATGTKDESAVSFPDYGPKAETGAIGRALAGLGFGTQFAIELDEGERLVDSPADRTIARGGSGSKSQTNDKNTSTDQGNAPQGSNGQLRTKREQGEISATVIATDGTPAKVTETQKTSLHALYTNLTRLGEPIEEPDYESLTNQQAKTTITTWSTRWRELKAASAQGNQVLTTQKR